MARQRAGAADAAIFLLGLLVLGSVPSGLIFSVPRLSLYTTVFASVGSVIIAKRTSSDRL